MAYAAVRSGSGASIQVEELFKFSFLRHILTYYYILFFIAAFIHGRTREYLPVKAVNRYAGKYFMVWIYELFFHYLPETKTPPQTDIYWVYLPAISPCMTRLQTPDIYIHIMTPLPQVNPTVSSQPFIYHQPT